MSDAPTIYVPLDSVAIALGAEEIAAAFFDAGFDVVRTGSRGMHWLEPLIEVEADDGSRIGYGPIEAADVVPLIAAINNGKFDAHRKHIGAVEALEWIKGQQRLIFARCGIIDPVSLEDYEEANGLVALKKAVASTSDSLCDDILASGLRGRGGAGFPAGIKWKTVAGAEADQKYVVCNADEGDSGTFADRMIMEGDPFLLIEGMAIAGLAVGATRGFIYLRSEYPVAEQVLSEAIRVAYNEGVLGPDVCASGKKFDLELFIGAGAYICGEETSLLNSLEGKRGEVRAKPPLPAREGLHAKPTLVHNVLSFCAVPDIVRDGGKAYAKRGVGKSCGTMPFQLSGDVKYPGLYEAPFGITLRELVEKIGGGTWTGKKIRAIQIGGPLGAYLPPSKFDTIIDYEALIAIGAGVGHGGVVVYNEDVDLLEQARYAFEFCAEESCGKCTPCRIGAVRGIEVIDRIKHGEDYAENMQTLADLCELMVDGSLCAMGGMTPIPVQSALNHFPEDFAFPSKRRTFGGGAEKTP